MITSQETCPCNFNGNEQIIGYPFGVQNVQGKRCGIQAPGFGGLTCDAYYQAVLNLPASGMFFVRRIDYKAKEITLGLNGNCMVLQRLIQYPLPLNLSPFRRMYDVNSNFFTCPSSITKDPSVAVALYSSNIFLLGCYSNVTFTMLAVPSTSKINPNVFSDGNCTYRTFPIPASYNFKSDELHLIYDTPIPIPIPTPQQRESNNGKSGQNGGVIGGATVAAVVILAVVAYVTRDYKIWAQARDCLMAALLIVTGCPDCFFCCGHGTRTT
ncbi:uncharacterized protein LOC113323738 isoform X1 [Papaver somniferum]|uniref:uncharacterized protein LOC113323738 isoform X1 n=1 Tax=Papaver somniferum TaxID=3469 RepID=UPI000E6FE9B8|nr:uncharacterized protein LOC113323738 isoform X1 [Papaver somniferum]